MFISKIPDKWKIFHKKSKNIWFTFSHPRIVYVVLDRLFCKYFRFLFPVIILLMFHIHGSQNLKCAIVSPPSIWSYLVSQLRLHFWLNAKVRKFSCVLKNVPLLLTMGSAEQQRWTVLCRSIWSILLQISKVDGWFCKLVASAAGWV